MTLDEALEAAMLGDRVRASNMQPGSYVDYNFNGWRRNFAGGSSSAFTFTDEDREAEWFVQPIGEPMKDGWGKPVGPCGKCGCTIVAHALFGSACGCTPDYPSRALTEGEVAETVAAIERRDKPAIAGGWGNVKTGESGVVRNKWGQPA